eukprot:GHVP01068401.1.p1 GENE.GHVP01068401.1~~GHVP01068401.1.p1  ORF type:complete len:316 (-),score=50.55 GHVP01068401.1:22-969(-)
MEKYEKTILFIPDELFRNNRLKKARLATKNKSIAIIDPLKANKETPSKLLIHFLTYKETPLLDYSIIEFLSTVIKHSMVERRRIKYILKHIVMIDKTFTESEISFKSRELTTTKECLKLMSNLLFSYYTTAPEKVVSSVSQFMKGDIQEVLQKVHITEENAEDFLERLTIEIDQTSFLDKELKAVSNKIIQDIAIHKENPQDITNLITRSIEMVYSIYKKNYFRSSIPVYKNLPVIEKNFYPSLIQDMREWILSNEEIKSFYEELADYEENKLPISGILKDEKKSKLLNSLLHIGIIWIQKGEKVKTMISLKSKT